MRYEELVVTYNPKSNPLGYKYQSPKTLKNYRGVHR